MLYIRGHSTGYCYLTASFLYIAMVRPPARIAATRPLFVVVVIQPLFGTCITFSVSSVQCCLGSLTVPFARLYTSVLSLPFASVCSSPPPGTVCLSV
jgi:hypothetical protein